MRVVFVSLIPNATWTGMGKWAHELAGELTSSGDSVVLWFEEDFTGMRRFGQFAIFLAPIAVAVRLITLRKSFDVAVVHEPLGFWYALARHLTRTLPGIVCMSHGVENRIFRLTLKAARSGAARISLRTRMTYWVTRGWQSAGFLKLADRVLCLSSVDRSYITERLGRHPSEVTFTVNGVDSPATTPAASRRPQSVLFVGGWINNKGRWIMPSIWNAVAETFPGASLSLVGTGLEARDIIPSFDPRFTNRIQVIPRVTTEAGMRQLYQEHEIFLMPSLAEGSPLSLLEAMSNGLVIVASTAGGIPDIIEEGSTGYLFDPLNLAQASAQLSRALSDPESAQALAIRATALAAKLTWASAASRIRPVLMAAAEA